MLLLLMEFENVLLAAHSRKKQDQPWKTDRFLITSVIFIYGISITRIFAVI